MDKDAILEKIGEVILEKVVDYLVAPIQREFKAVCFFNSNISELETQLKGLKRTREDVQMGVDENRRKVRKVGPTVEDWLTIADEVTTEAKRIIKDKAKVKEGCLNGWCPNLKLRYSLSRKAVKKIEEVVDLKADGVRHTRSSYSPLPPSSETITNRDFTEFDSRRAKMREIIKALTDDRIKLIGICGLPGLGKTKMVQEVGKKAKEEKLFDEVAFVAVGQNCDITKVQNSIADNFGLNDLKTKDDAATRASLLRKRLLQDNKKVLLILDDIWAEFNLEDHGIPLGGSHETFKIIYTSRNQGIWDGVPNKKEIPLELLLEDEAWQLFREKAGDSADTRALQPIAKQIVNECGRLPLALVLIGIVLSKNTTRDIWEEMLDRLTRAGNTPANEQLFSRLALSYEYLENKQAKRLFLLCCLFQEDEDIDIEDLARYGLGLSFFDGINEMEKVRRRVLVLVNLLKSNYLLLDGKDDEFVKVHDVVRYVGISIAAKDRGALVIHGEVSEWPQKDTYKDYTYISLISTKITELPKELTCLKLEFLLIDCKELKELPRNFFKGMKKLKVLVLKNVKGILALPPSLRNLHTLSLSNFHGKLNNGRLFNLKTLSFRNSWMMVLPEEIGELVDLRLLDLTGIDVFRIPPNVISRLVDLEELYVGDDLKNRYADRGFMDWEGEGKEEGGSNANLRELESLSNLNTLEICIRSDVLIPKARIFSKLKIYKVTIVQVDDEEMDDDGNDVEMDDDDDGDDEEMDGDDKEMDDDIWDRGLEDESDNLFRKCKRVFRVESSIPIPLYRGGIYLLLRNSDCLVLEGKGCNDLVQALLLRDGVDGLQPLKLLRIRRCDTPECLINTMNPVHLRIAYAPIFPILKVLDLLGLVNLGEIWRICGGPVPARSFGELTFIRIHNCGRLRNLFQLPIVGCLPQLKRLIISSCRMMEEVFWKDQQDDVHAATNQIEFPKLEVLKLVKLPRLVGFCRGIDQIDFPQLKELYLEDIPRVNFLFHNNGHLSSNSKRNGNVGFLPLFPEKVSLPNLEVLHVDKLENLERLEHRPFSVGSFSKLKQFWVRDCGKLLCVIPSQFLRMLRELQILIVESCNSLEVVFELEALESNEPNPEILSTLKFVKLRDLPKLGCISKRYPMDIKYIQTLEIHNCNSLSSVFAPTRTKSIPQLRDLKVSSCKMLTRIVREENRLGESSVDEVEFPQLERLELLDLPNLISFFPNVNTATLAKSNDHLYNPMQPQPLFTEKVAIPSLECMKLIGLQNVSDLWGSELPISSFSKLKNLQVIGCTSLGYIPCILWSGDLHNTTQDLQEVAQLLYRETNGVLALRSNGTMTLWEWGYSDQNQSAEVAANSTLPFREYAMTNDVIGVNLDEAVPCMAISKQYSHYIISACGGEVSLYDRLNFLAKRTFMPPPPASTFFAFYPRDENIIAIGMEDSTIRMYNHREDEVKTELKGHRKRITGLAFSTNLNILVSSAADAQLRIWRIDTWERLKSVSIQLPPDKACNGDTRVQFHSDQIRLLVSHETQLAIYDASEMDCIRQWVPQDVLPAPISFAVYSCDSQLVYTSFCDGNIGVFDADSLTLACRIVTSIYLYPAMLNGGQAVYPKVIVAHPKKPNQFAIGLTNGFVVIMKPQESKGKWGLSPSTVDNGMLNDRTASSSNTSNHTPDQNEDGPMARSMEKPKTLDDVTDKSKPWKVAETQCQLVVMPDNTDEAHKVARLLYRNGCEVLALGCNGALRLWRRYSSINNQSGMATASVVPQQWQLASGLAMKNDVTGVNLEEAVPCMALSKNYSKMISACGGEVSLFYIELNRAAVMRKFMSPPPSSTFLAFHPQDDEIIAIGMEDSTIRIYNPWKDWTNGVGSELKGHEKRITGLAFSTNLNILVSSGADAQLCIWSIKTWERLKSVPIQLPAGKACNGNTTVQFHSDQIRLLVSHETQLVIYDGFKMDHIHQWVPQDVLPAPISFAAYSCDSQRVYTSFCDGNIGVFDADSLTPTHRIAPSAYSPTLSSGSHAVYPLVVATHPWKPNQFAIGLTNGSVIIMEPQESKGKWGLSSNTSNHAPDQNQRKEEEELDEDEDEEDQEENGVGPMARSMEKPKTLDDVTDKSKPRKVVIVQSQLLGMPNSIDEAHKVGRLLYTNYGDGVLALGSNGTMTLWKWVRSQQNPSGKATASVIPLQWRPASGLPMTNDVIGVNLEEAVPCMALSNNDSYIISACGGTVSLFSTMTLMVLRTFMPPPPASTFLAIYPQDNDIIAIGMEDSTIRIYNVRVDELKSKLKGHEKRITGLAFSTKLNKLVSSGADAQLCIWRIDTWEHLKSVSIQLPAGEACNSDTRVQFHCDQIHLLVSHETQLAIYDASEMDRIRHWVPQDILLAPISFAVYSCDSQIIYSSFCNGNIGVFVADSLSLIWCIAPCVYLSPKMLSGSQAVYPRVVAAHPQKPNQFAIWLTNGFVIVMELLESESKLGLSPSTVDNGMLNDRIASSSNTSNRTPDQVRRRNFFVFKNKTSPPLLCVYLPL